MYYIFTLLKFKKKANQIDVLELISLPPLV